MKMSERLVEMNDGQITRKEETLQKWQAIVAQGRSWA
jgi:hypothetical protein